MLFSDMGWQYKDYWRIVDWLEADGRFGLAAKWEDWIRKNVPTPEEETFSRFKDTLNQCKEIGTNLVLIPWAGAQSGTVAKYQGRVYSLPGAKSKFPVLPSFIMETGCVVPPQGGGLIPFLFWNDPKLDTFFYKSKECPALRTSWRPFIDDRSPEEKKSYYDRMHKILEQEHKETNHRLYIRLRHAFPNICPERLNTFYGWARTKPDHYQLIVDAAAAAGLSIPVKEFQLPDNIEPPDPDPSYRGGRVKPFFL